MVPQVWHEKVSLLGLAMLSFRVTAVVIPAKAGISLSLRFYHGHPKEVPAFAGMTTLRGDDDIYFTAFHEPSG
jgi:hypothetical protein